MPRKYIAAPPLIPVHINARCINKEWFRIPLLDVWNIFSDYLYFMVHAHNIRIHSFVLMNNHFHMVVNTTENNLSSAMNYFMRETSRCISRESGRINQIYGGPYHKTLIRSDSHFFEAQKYVYRNPVEAGLIEFAESYRYSTLHCALGFEHSTIPFIAEDPLFSDTENYLRWINTSYRNQQTKNLIRCALKKAEFKFAKNRPDLIENLRQDSYNSTI